MNKLSVRLRHGTSEPIRTEVDGSVLTRIRGVKSTLAIQQILQSLPEEKRPYGQAMLATMQGPDAVVEVVSADDEEVVTVDRAREEPFDQLLSRIARRYDGDTGKLELIEIATARLEKGGAITGRSASHGVRR